jgi:hypothetical protein
MAPNPTIMHMHGVTFAFACDILDANYLVGIYN